MKKIIILFLIIFSFGFKVQAYDNKVNYSNNTGNNIEIEKLYDYMNGLKTKHEILNGLDIREYVQDFIKSGDGKISVKKAVEAITTYSIKEVRASLKLMSIVVVIAILCAFLTNLQKAFSGEGLSQIAYFACYSFLIVIIARSFYLGVDLARETIRQMSDLLTAIMPPLIMLMVSVGGIVEAATIDPIVIGTITLSTKFFMDIIIPIICITFVLQFVNNLSDDYKVNKLTKLLNSVAIWSQGIVMTLFIGIVTVRGISSKTIDQVTAKTAKFAVDTLVPIVGKSLSDAVSTVAGYSILLKNAFSTLGLIVLVVIMLFPVIKLLVMALIYKLSAALIEPISDSKLVNAINSAGDSLILIMSCVISVSVMFFIILCIIASAGKMAIGG